MRFIPLLLLLAYSAFGACTKISMPTDFSSVASGTRANLKANFSEAENKFNPCADSVDEIRGRFSGYGGSLLMSSLENLRLRLDSDASATSKFIVEGSSGDTLFRVSEDSTARFFGPLTGTTLTLSGAATTTGVHTFAAAPIVSALTASLPVFTDGSKALASNAMTGTGSVVMSASPTLTGTAGFANTSNSGTLAVTGVATFTAAPVFSSATASLPMFTDGSKGLVSNAMTGTGSVMMSASPTTTGTLTGAAANFSGAVSTGAVTATTGAFSSTLGVTGVFTAESNPVIATNNINGSLLLYTNSTGAANWTAGIGGSAGGAFPDGAYSIRNTTSGNTALSISSAGAATFSGAPIFSSVTASQFLLVDGSKALTSVAGTGTGSVVRETSPTITTPTFSGTVASGLTASRTVITDGSGNLAVNTETGTGSHVRATSPTLVTPTLGAATATTIATSGVTTATGGLTLGARFIDHTTSLTANTTLSTTHSTIFASATGGSFTLTLPAAAGAAGLTYTIFKTDASANTVTADGNASETIGGATTVVLGGNVGNSRLVIVCDGTNWQIKELYDEGTFTATLTGVTATVSGSFYYTLNGRDVTLLLSSLTGTSNTTAATITGMPSTIRPARTQVIAMENIYNATLAYSGYLAIATDGTISPYYRNVIDDIPTNTFTNSGTKGIGTITIPYTLQ